MSKIQNGTTIHRVWSTMEDAELIALVQYDSMAKAICEALIDQQPEGCSLVYVDHYDGKMNIVRSKSDAKVRL